MAESKEPPRGDRFDWIALAVLGAFAAALRFTGLERLPPALWFDEGLNGVDALALARGGPWPMVFPGVFPREPLQVYLIALFVKALGPETVAVRLASALVGSLAPPLAYLWLRQAAPRRAAFLSAFFLAGMRWHVHFSRFGLRTIWTPTLALAMLALLWRAFRTGKVRWAVAAGAMFGLGFYSYLSWYFFVPVAGLALALGLWREGPQPKRWPALTLGFCLAALVAAAPMAVHYARVPTDLFGRPREVSPFRDGAGAALAEIGKNARDASLMLFWRGDHVSKQNIPWQPALEPIGAILFFVGLARCLRNWRQSAPAGVLLAWLVCGTMPTVFSKTDSPNFLRTLILTPAVAALVGYGADWVGQGIERQRGNRRVGTVVPALLVGASVAAMLALYFNVWAQLPTLWLDFSGQADQIARYARTARQGEEVYVPTAICEESYTYRFLAADARRAQPFSPAEAFGPGPDPADDHLVIESENIDPKVRLAIARSFPKAELAEEFPVRGLTENGLPWIWARSWRLRAGDRLDAASAHRAAGEWAPPATQPR